MKIARDLNVTTLPSKMTKNGEDIDEDELADKFAEFFDTKIKNLSGQATIDPSIYNGKKKINCENKMFMDEHNKARIKAQLSQNKAEKKY